MTRSILLRTAVGAAVLALQPMLATTASANTLTYQGLTFEMVAGGGNTINLTISGTPTGDWSGVSALANFEIKDVGSFATGVTGGGTTWGITNNALGAGGCTNGSSSGGCYTAATAVASYATTYTVAFAGPVDLSAPHLKVRFLDSGGSKEGSLLSQTVPVPEPQTYALMLAGLGIVGFMARRRQNK